MQDDNNTNNSDYFIVDFNNRSLMIEDFKNLQRKNYFNDEVIE